MTDREKVIKGLECHKRAMYGSIDEHGHACNLCPYRDMDNSCRPRTEGKLISDALALLKSQEPRVISREEWDEWRHIPDGKREPLYVQDSTVGWWILKPSNWLEIAFLTGEIKIWNKRPTDAQREATGWNERSVQ